MLQAAPRASRLGWVEQLVLAADAFVFARPLPGVADGRSVIAGYPWFGDWGRDTMIGLPGLTLATGRADVALRILETFARFVSEGMLPNVFPGAGETPAYNTADASLWFFEAWRAYIAATDDVSSLRDVFPVLADMVDWHRRGTRYGIAVDPADGLLRAGEPGVQLTWMDAKVGDYVVTPRIGKPVEINALWYNALTIMAGFAATLGETDAYRRAGGGRPAPASRASCGADGEGLTTSSTARTGPTTASVRTRSLPSACRTARSTPPCRRAWSTPAGATSSPPTDCARWRPGSPEYRPPYAGGVAERDGGYHQGAVWAWLLGHFALRRPSRDGPCRRSAALLLPMRDALADQGLGTIGEIFDGDPPHEPRGAPAQAWSVACTLQAWHRCLQAGPRHGRGER